MDDATFSTFLSLARGTSAMSRFNCRALLGTGSSQSVIRYGYTPSSMRQYNAMSSLTWPKQLDVLLIALHSSPRGTWSALTDPRPHGPRHGRYHPCLRWPEPLELLRFFGLTNNPLTGYKDLEDDVIPVTESFMTSELRSIPRTKPPELLCRLES